jgi:WD40 repeat protein
MLSAQTEKQIDLWDPVSRCRLRTLEGRYLPFVEGHAWSPDGKLIAGFIGPTAMIWEADTGRRRGVLLPGIDGLAISADGYYRGKPAAERAIVMVVQKDDGSTEVLEPADFERKYKWKNDPNQVHLLKPLPPPLVTPEGAPISPDALVQQPAEVKGVRSWTVETLNPRQSTHAIAVRPDGKCLATGGGDGTVRIWDVGSGQVVRMLIHGSPVHWLSWSPDGKMLVSSNYFYAARLWDVETGRLVRLLPGRDAGSWSPDGRTVALAAASELRLWDVATGKVGPTHRFSTYVIADQRVTPVWSPDGRILALPSDKVIRLWDVKAAKELRTLEGHTQEVLGISWSPDGRRLASTARGERTFCIWDPASTKPLHVFPVPKGTTCVAWSPDGQSVAVGCSETGHGIYDPETGRQLVDLRDAGHTLRHIAWAADSQKVVATGISGTRVLDATSGRVLETLERSVVPSVYSAAWSPDGQALAVGQVGTFGATSPAGLSLFDVRTGRARWPIIPTAGQFVAWSANGQRVAAADRSGTLRLWDAQTGQEQRTLEGKVETGFLYALAWSPDESTLAAAMRRRVFAWSAETGKQLWRSEEMPGGDVGALAWSPDSKQLTGVRPGNQGELWIWPDGGGGRKGPVPCRGGQRSGSPPAHRWCKNLACRPALVRGRPAATWEEPSFPTADLGRRFRQAVAVRSDRCRLWGLLSRRPLASHRARAAAAAMGCDLRPAAGGPSAG